MSDASAEASFMFLALSITRRPRPLNSQKSPMSIMKMDSYPTHQPPSQPQSRSSSRTRPSATESRSRRWRTPGATRSRAGWSTSEKTGFRSSYAKEGEGGTLFPCTWNGLVIDTSPNTPADKMMLNKGEIVMPERDRPLRRIKYLLFWQNEDVPLTDIVGAVSSVAFKNLLGLSRGLWQLEQVAGMIELKGRRGGFGDRPAKGYIKHGGTFRLRLSPLAHLAP
ncbi:hypothetical protein BKA80DRAFT_306519 [Phyllosticta citrichinensis]